MGLGLGLDVDWITRKGKRRFSQWASYRKGLRVQGGNRRDWQGKWQIIGAVRNGLLTHILLDIKDMVCLDFSNCSQIGWKSLLYIHDLTPPYAASPLL